MEINFYLGGGTTPYSFTVNEAVLPTKVSTGKYIYPAYAGTYSTSTTDAHGCTIPILQVFTSSNQMYVTSLFAVLLNYANMCLVIYGHITVLQDIACPTVPDAIINVTVFGGVGGYKYPTI